MGSIIRLICEDCEKKPISGEQYIACFSIGIGMLYSKERLLGNDELSEPPMLKTIVTERRVKKEIDEMLKQKCYIGLDYGYGLYYCNKCNKIVSKFKFEITNSDKTYRPDYWCSKCKNKMENVSIIGEKGNAFIVKNDNERTQYYCPICGSNRIKIEEIAIWD